MTLYCGCCQLPKHDLYCPSCIHEGVETHRNYAVSLSNQSAAAVSRSKALLSTHQRGVSAWRQLRSQIAAQEARIQVLKEQLEAKRSAAASLGKRDLRPVTLLASSSRLVAKTKRRLVEVKHTQSHTKDRILHARRVLVREAINIFSIKTEGARWTIAGLVLPSPDEFLLHPSVEINAALAHLIHLLSLVLRYLSIAPPFVFAFPRQTHIGRPYLRANVPFLNTTKFREKATLWMSSTAVKRDSRSTAKHRQFLVAFALMSHTVSYIAWTQGVEGIGVGTTEQINISAVAVLELMDALSRSPLLGVRSHEPGTNALGHLGFSLDVNAVVEHVSATEDDGEFGWVAC